eukprot:4753272-Pleurochrysis_carterae.AAC.1
MQVFQVRRRTAQSEERDAMVKLVWIELRGGNTIHLRRSRVTAGSGSWARSRLARCTGDTLCSHLAARAYFRSAAAACCRSHRSRHSTFSRRGSRTPRCEASKASALCVAHAAPVRLKHALTCALMLTCAG